MMTKTSVMIADDQEILLEGMKLLLGEVSHLAISTESNSERVVAEYFTRRPDVLICDIRFTNAAATGMDMLKEIVERDSDAKIIMHSQYDEGELIKKAYQLGAKAFLSKSADIDEIIEAIDSVNSGNTLVPNNIAQTLAEYTISTVTHHSAALEQLTPRQIDVFKAIAKGLTQDEIADYLKVHKRTVTTETKHIKSLMNIERTSEFTLLALENKLLKPNDILKRA